MKSETQFTIGKLLKDERYRDAIHIAVMPVRAGERLSPGQHICFWGEASQGRVGRPLGQSAAIGIVDPFLTGAVPEYERFWMFLYPNTITTLRHEWTHPALHADVHTDSPESEKWLRKFADDADLSYEALLEGANDYAENKNYLSEGGKWESFYTPDEFWIHYEAVTGKKVAEEKRGNFFSCSC